MFAVNVAPDALDALVEQLASAVAAKMTAETLARQGPRIPAERLALSPGEAAEALSISERLLWDLTKTGQIRATKAGSRTIYARAELLRYLGAAEMQKPARGESCGPKTCDRAGSSQETQG